MSLLERGTGRKDTDVTAAENVTNGGS